MVSVLFAATLSLSPSVLPPPGGPATVGTRSVSFIDPSRKDPLDSGKQRTILVKFWYPASVKSGARAPYLPPALLDAMRFDQYLDVDIGLLDGWDAIQTHSYHKSPPTRETTPLIIFSPGFGMSLASYTTIAEDLASRGITVAAIDHPYGGLSIFPDGKLRTYTSYRAKPPQRVREIAGDQSFLLTRLKAGGLSLPPIDWKHVVAAGHSIGGAGALETGRTDTRFAGTIDLDGDVWGDVESKGTRLPFLVLNNEPGPPVHIPPRMKKERLDEWKGVLAKSSGPGTEVVIHHTDHFSFTDAPFLLPRAVRARSGATLDPLDARRTIVDLMVAFTERGTAGLRHTVSSHPNAKVLLSKG